MATDYNNTTEADMGEAVRQIVAESATGWWGRFGLWVARVVFRLETASRTAPVVMDEPTAIVPGEARTRDYILVGAIDGLPDAGHTDAANDRSGVDGNVERAAGRDPSPPAAVDPVMVPFVPGVDDTVPAMPTDTVIPTDDGLPVGTAEQEPAPIIVEPASAVHIDGDEATVADEPVVLAEIATIVAEIDEAVVNDSTVTDVEPAETVAQDAEPHAENDPASDDVEAVADEPDVTVTKVETVDEVVAVETPAEHDHAEDTVDAAPPPPNRQARRAAKRQALRPLRTPVAVKPETPVVAEATEVAEADIPVAPAPTIETADIEDAVIDLPQEVDAVADEEPSAKTVRPRRAPRPANYNAPVDEPTLGFANAIDMHHVLDRLPRYFEHLKMLRNVDADAYTLFARLGGQIALSDGTRFSIGGISPEFLANPPQVRCVFLHSEVDGDGVTEDDMVPASIIYMMRLAGGQVCVNGQSQAMIPKDGLTYRYVTVLQYKGKPYVQSCFVHIGDDGTVRALPERQQVRQAIPGRHHENSPTSIRHNRVEIPSWIRLAAHEKGQTADEWITTVVSICASAKRPDDAILVRAHKAGIAAAWTINRRDAKRFFAARELDETGRRRRVLHYVASFDRVTANGVQSVREHYRGAREFEWQGYDIEVSGLNFHHKDFFDAPIAQVEDDGDGPAPMSMVSLKKAVRGVVEHYRAPFSLSKGRRKAA